MSTRIAVDTGGTFTDLVMLQAGVLTVHKLRSTPDDPARAVLAGMKDLLNDGRADLMIHGSTVATNALLERKGSRLAFVTTAGFEDILRIGRQTRGELYNIFVADKAPLVEDALSFGVEERITATGEIMQPLEPAEVSRLLTRLREAAPDSVAICLLNSYVNPSHEEQLLDELKRTGFTAFASHQILPEYREYERASTTAINAYVAPVMSRYLSRLEENVAAAKLLITQSAGGFISAKQARDQPGQTVLSGPAAGAVGALKLAQASGFDRVIAFDVGGTSTDVSLLDGDLPLTTESTVGDFPIRLPMLDIHTVGAGGGSIAYLDAGGALRVGPRSAGAVPGPVCYGSGDELTVTDANVLLGRLDASSFLGGRMALDIDRTCRIAEDFARKLAITPIELAEGIVRVSNSNIERALRVVSVQRGYDPRDFALLAFGGAGAMHACDLAQALDIKHVLVPRHAGLLSALGMLLADYINQYSQSVLRTADETAEEQLEDLFNSMTERARRHLEEQGFSEQTSTLSKSVDLRYLGQSYEITLPFSRDYRRDFHQAHQRLYGYRNDLRAVEIVNVRLKATGHTAKPSFPDRAALKRGAPPATDMRQTFFGGKRHDTPLFTRESLEAGASACGPALVAAAEWTAVISPGWQFSVDGVGTLILSRQSSAPAR